MGKGVLKIDSDALFLPIAIADRFWSVATTKLCRQVQCLRGLAAFGGLRQRALRGGGKLLYHRHRVGRGFWRDIRPRL